MTGRIRGVGHVALVTRDLERLSAFYRDVFAAETSERSEVDRRLGLGFIQVGATSLHVFERPDGPLGGVSDERATDAFSRGRIDHFSLEAADLDTFVAGRDRLVELGATDGTVVDFGPIVSVFFADPDGFHIELSLTKTPDWDPPFEAATPGRLRG
jgi:catechol 2,3-dioxygenase-like lactoylglutathione lyase family enzyme